MRKIGGDEPTWIVATISKPAFGRETCFVGWTTTDMQGSDPGRIGEGHAAEEPRHTLCSCARLRMPHRGSAAEARTKSSPDSRPASETNGQAFQKSKAWRERLVPPRGGSSSGDPATPYSSPKKCRIAKLNCRGSCKNAKWLLLGRINSPAFGIVAAIYSVCSRLIASSWSPSTTSTGVSIAASCASLQFGCSAHILLICSTNELYSLGVAD